MNNNFTIGINLFKHSKEKIKTYKHFKRQRHGVLEVDIKAKQIILLNTKKLTLRLKNSLNLSKELVVFVDETNHKFLLIQ